jgi:hypothetical protein
MLSLVTVLKLGLALYVESCPGGAPYAVRVCIPNLVSATWELAD